MGRSSAVTKPLEGADTEIRAGQHQAPLLVSSEPSRERSWPTHTAERRVPHRGEQRGEVGPRRDPLEKFASEQPQDQPLHIMKAARPKGEKCGKNKSSAKSWQGYIRIRARMERLKTLPGAPWKTYSAPSVYLVLCCFYLLFTLLHSSVIKAQFAWYYTAPWNRNHLLMSIHLQYMLVKCREKSKIFYNNEKWYYISIFTVHCYSLLYVLYYIC